MIKQKYEHILFSNKVYNYIFKPFDKILFPIVNKDDLKLERMEKAVPFNKIPNVTDLYNPAWQSVLMELSQIFPMDENTFHRKIWEFTQIIYILKETGYLHPDNSGLAIGAGREQILYYLAHKISRITGIDLYEGNYIGGEDEPDIPISPEKYAPFLYPQANLELIKMDALDLKFENNTFDFLFSASSIEHFGSKKQILRSLREMYRVLKPGAIAVITTELKLNRLGRNIPNTRIFKLKQILDLFDQAQFLINKDDIDIKIEDHYFNTWVKLPQEVYKTPHLILRFLRTIFTSLALVFKKPGAEVKKGAWQEMVSFPPFEYNGYINISLVEKIATSDPMIPIRVKLKNNSNFNWYSKGMSHRISIGIKLMDLKENFIDDAFGEIIIPQDLKIAEKFEFEASVPINLAPGKYKLFFDLKRELITWFSEQGSKPCIVQIEVI